MAGLSTAPSGPTLPVISNRDPRYVFNILTGAGGGVVLTLLDGSDPVEIGTDVPGVHKRDDISPDRKHVAFVDETTETMWIAHLDGSPTTQVPGCDHNGCDFPAFSPDGKRLVYSRSLEGSAGTVGPGAVRIEIVELATGKVTSVVSLSRPLLSDEPRWSPDGTKVVVGVDQMDDQANETGAAIAIVPVAGGEPTYLTKFPTFGYDPDWNAATGLIVFSDGIRRMSTGFDPATSVVHVWVIRPDGTGLREVVHSQAGEQLLGAKWAPDGTRLFAFSTTRGGAVSIDVATGEITPLQHPRDASAPRLLQP
jgi:Tol biopolymer transport system component